jgi:hypothetical protein
VEWQLALARTLGFATTCSTDYEIRFWNDAVPPNRLSVLPSRLGETIARLGPRPFVARAGNGVIYFHGEAPADEQQNLPTELMRRVKMAYDPKHLLPEFCL